MTKPIFLLGAYDRFNYGDLLFPIIVEKALRSRNSSLQFAAHALVESDLSEFGAVKTLPIRALFKPGYVPEGSTVIVAGGGVLGSSWHAMNMNLSVGLKTSLLYYAAKFLGVRAINELSRYRFGSPSPWPWIIDPDHLPPGVKVIYNSVGGSYLARLPVMERDQIILALSRASYISVRDQATKSLLAPMDQNDNVKLVPDSAVVMSDLFPITWLTQHVEPSTNEFLNRPKKYFCFQMWNGWQASRIDELAVVLDDLAEEINATPLLLPIGRAQGHEDHIGLTQLCGLMKSDAILPKANISIFDIMHLIANSSLFIGTSLHGAVTSESYSVPHLGLEDVIKLQHYRESWEIEGQDQCTGIEKLISQSKKVLAIPQEARDENRDRLLAATRDNFDNIAAAIAAEV